MSTMFEAFRKNGQPTFYEENKTPWEEDLLTSGLIFAFAIVAFSFYITIPGSCGSERLFSFIRTTTSLFIGAVIIVTQFTQTWEVAETYAHTKYKAGTGKDVNVTIGAWIGFKGVNITMKGDDNQIKGETINYNEHFNWDGLQGRIGFGPNAGQFNRDYREAQFRGLPLPILWAAEYFTFDGEGIRWGRFYRQAGWYAHIMLWLAFPLWILANILFCVLLRYGAYFLAMTGLSMLTSNIIWATLRNVNQLEIPFTDTAKLEFSYGASFWICLATGILCIILGGVVFVLDKLHPNAIATFFNVDVLQDSEKILEEAKPEDMPPPDGNDAKTEGEGNGAAPAKEVDEDYLDDDDDELYLPPPPRELAPSVPEDRAAPHVITPPDNDYRKSRFRSNESRMTIKFQKPRRRPPPPPQEGNGHDMDDPEEEDLYANCPTNAMPMRHM